MVEVQDADLRIAVEFVSSAPPSEHYAYVSLDTGEIYWGTADGGVMDENAPADLETSGRYTSIPHKYDFDLGSDLALRFAATRLPRQYGAVEEFFRSRGAYARFKSLLQREGKLDEWYEFSETATDKALKDWCRTNEIELV